MLIVKYSFCYFNRCIVSLLEENDHFAILAELFGKSLTYNFEPAQIEEIVINLTIILTLNKIFFLIFYDYYC